MSTQTTTIACNNCGAALRVSDDTRFVTCTYCHSQLAVHRTGASAYTEVLQQVKENTDRIAADVGAIRVQNELEALDRQWMIERESYMVTDKRGHRRHPGGGVASLVGGIIMGLFGVVWTVLAAGSGAPGPFALFGVLFIVVAIGGGIYGFTKANQYGDAERRYQARRRELEQRLRAAGGGDGR